MKLLKATRTRKEKGESTVKTERKKESKRQGNELSKDTIAYYENYRSVQRDRVLTTAVYFQTKAGEKKIKPNVRHTSNHMLT